MALGNHFVVKLILRVIRAVVHAENTMVDRVENRVETGVLFEKVTDEQAEEDTEQ